MSEHIFKIGTALLGFAFMGMMPTYFGMANQLDLARAQLTECDKERAEERAKNNGLSADIAELRIKHAELEHTHKDQENDLAMLKLMQESIEGENSALATQLKVMEDLKAKAESDLRKATTRLNSLETKVQQLSAKVQAREGELAATKRELADVRAVLQTSEESNIELQWNILMEVVQVQACGQKAPRSCRIEVLNNMALAKNSGIDALRQGCTPRYITSSPIAEVHPIRLPSGWVELCPSEPRE